MSLDREHLGHLVRDTWIAWAMEQPDPKPHWLTPWSELDEPMKEVDRRIGETVVEQALPVLNARLKRAEDELRKWSGHYGEINPCDGCGDVPPQLWSWCGAWLCHDCIERGLLFQVQNLQKSLRECLNIVKDDHGLTRLNGTGQVIDQADDTLESASEALLNRPNLPTKEPKP